MRNQILFAAMLACCGLVACGAPSDSPEAAVEAFLDACQDGDEAALLASLQRSDRETLERMRARGGEHSFGPGAGFDYEIGKVKTRGITATAEVTLTKDGARETQSLALIKEDGQWRVDLIPDEMAPLFEGLDGMAESMTEGMGKGLPDALRSMGQDAQGGMEEAMRRMADDMQRGLPEKR